MLQRKAIAFDAAAIKADGDTRRFEGYASVFGGKDSYGDTIVAGAFKTTLGKRSARGLKMGLNHDLSMKLPIGRWIKASEDEHGLHVVGELTPGMSLADDVYAAMKHGTLDGLSIGFYLKDADYESLSDGGRLIKRVSDLVEVSVVTFPADSAARVSDVKTLDDIDVESIQTIRDFERVLRDAGHSKGLASALAARASVLFGKQGEPAAETPEAKAQREVAELMRRFAERALSRLT